jgi:hypothetical protein
MNTETRRILTEEAWRSIVWFGIAFFGWGLIITQTTALEATGWTVLGLPLATTFTIAALLVLYRLQTGAELQGNTDSARINWLIGAIIVGFLTLYHILANDANPVVFGSLYVGSLVVGYLLLQRSTRTERHLTRG